MCEEIKYLHIGSFKSKLEALLYIELLLSFMLGLQGMVGGIYAVS